MAYRSFSEAFIIIRQDEYGRPVEIIPYNTDEATYVAVSISICRGMLRDPMVKTAFKKLAESFDPESSEAWYKDFPKSEVVGMFIYEILERFPLVFVDYSLKNPDFRACHYRRAWDRGYGFDTHEQAIVVNGPRVRDMCIAGASAERTEDPNSDERKRFRVFLFIFAKSFLHELGHMFVTFLGRGNTGTPPRMNVQLAGRPQSTEGEAGRYLENLVFGGLVSVLRNPAEGDSQAGVCCLVKAEYTREILQETIDEFVKYQFSFPIERFGAPIPNSMISLGQGLPRPTDYGDPIQTHETQQLLSAHKAGPFRWDKEVDDLLAQIPQPRTLSEHEKSVMRRVPFGPSLLVEDPSEPRAQAVK